MISKKTSTLSRDYFPFASNKSFSCRGFSVEKKCHRSWKEKLHQIIFKRLHLWHFLKYKNKLLNTDTVDLLKKQIFPYTYVVDTYLPDINILKNLLFRVGFIRELLFGVSKSIHYKSVSCSIIWFFEQFEIKREWIM